MDKFVTLNKDEWRLLKLGISSGNLFALDNLILKIETVNDLFITCPVCGKETDNKIRCNKRYCSNACRSKAYRLRKKFNGDEINNGNST